MQRLLALVVLASFVLGACGSSDDESAADTTEAPATTAAPAATDAPTTEAPATTAAAEEGGPTEVVLAEFSVEVGDVTEGLNTFEVTNAGNFPHEFGIAVGTSYEELPLLDNGAIDEETLGAAVLGRTATLNGGESETIQFDLPAGDYVFFCNIAVGPNSHAAAGQVLSVSVG